MVACPARAELHRYLIQDDSLSPEQIERIVEHIESCPACQELLDGLTGEEDPPGTTLPHLPGYRVYKYLGAGAFGEVWLAQDLNLPRVVAAKTLKLGVTSNGRAKALEALRQDAHLMTQVEHPNVVRVHAWLTVHDHHYLVMQYVSGGSLSDLVKSEGPLDWQRAARYVADVGEGLLEVHARGIVHRDVKPANILWDPRTDEALLTDFGVAARLADLANIAGSIPYMAPEAFDGRVSPSLDVYSLAATFFHLVTGSAPFPSSRIADLKEEISRGLPDPDPRCEGLPEPLERIIRDGLTADVESPAQPEGLRLPPSWSLEPAHRRFLRDGPPTRLVPSLDRASPRRRLEASRRTDHDTRPAQARPRRSPPDRQPPGQSAPLRPRGHDPSPFSSRPTDPRHEEGPALPRPGPAPNR